MFLLVDGNNFFVGCEQVFAPHLKNHPTVVLSNGDGCVIARSQKAKEIGIPMGAPLFKISDLITQHRVVMFTSNFALYADFSRRMMLILKQFSPHVEVYSVDEAFLFVSESIDTLTELAHTIRAYILKTLGLYVSIGIAPSKTLAKVANQLAKKHPSGVMLIDTTGVNKTLTQIPISDVWGIGKKTTQSLRRHGIFSAKDFINCDQRWVRKVFHVTGERTHLELKGINCSSFEEKIKNHQSIQITRGFVTPQNTLEGVEGIITGFVNTLGEKLRRTHLRARYLSIFLRDSKLRGHGAAQSLFYTFDTPTHDTTELMKAAMWCVRTMFIKGLYYRRAGVIASELSPDEQVGVTQTHMLESHTQVLAQNCKRRKLFDSLDQLNRRFGKGSIHMGYVSKNALQPSNSQHNSFINNLVRSQPYTTNWQQLMLVR